jgi:GTPase SAR1 family protein
MIETREELVAFLKEYLAQLQTMNIILTSLRFKPLEVTYAFEGDYDFITSQSNIETITKTLFEMASERCLNFAINNVKFGKHMVYLFGQNEKDIIILEIWTHLDVKFSKETLGYIFYEDLMPFLVQNEDTSSSLRIDIEALYYISHLQSKRKDLQVPLIQTRLNHYKTALQNQKEISSLFEALLKEPLTLHKIAHKANTMLVEKKVLFTKQDSSKYKEEQKLRFNISKHRIYAQWLKKIKIIPLVGPDGVGKTSIIETIIKMSKNKIVYYRFKNLFRHSILYAFIKMFYSKEFKSYPKNQYDDLLSTWNHTIARIRYPIFALISLFGKRFYFSDRFFHDLILQDVRFEDRKAKLKDNYQELMQKTPNTFLFVHLDAPTNIIRSRKEELTVQAIDLYRNGIFKLYTTKQNLIYVYINTNNSLEACVRTLLHQTKDIGIKTKPIEEEMNHNLLLSKGNERNCYIHPKDSQKVIKVTHDFNRRSQNKIEQIYYTYLKKHKIPLTHIVTCYGYETINNTKGLVFDKVVDFDMKTSLTLNGVIKQKLLDEKQIDLLLQELETYLHKYSIIFSDSSFDNIMCQEIEPNTYKLIIIDGLGTRRLGLQYWLARNIKLYREYKMRNRWEKMLKNKKIAYKLYG